jgi:hypothetical protein
MNAPRNQTIRRNSKALKAAFANLDLYTCKAFTLSNGFTGQECAPKHAMEEFQEFSFCTARYNERGNIVIRVHSNCWYVLTLKEEAAPAPLPTPPAPAPEEVPAANLKAVEAAAHAAINTLFEAGFTAQMLRAMTHEEIMKELNAVTRRNAFAIVA